MNIYIGNLHHSTTDGELREAFEAFGAVTSVSIIKDKVTGLPRGFAFVEMPTEANAQAAVRGLRGHAIGGNALKVNAAKPRGERPGNGSGNGRD